MWYGLWVRMVGVHCTDLRSNTIYYTRSYGPMIAHKGNRRLMFYMLSRFVLYSTEAEPSLISVVLYPRASFPPVSGIIQSKRRTRLEGLLRWLAKIRI